MVDLPANFTKLVNAEKLLLKTGGTPDTYIALQDLEFHIGRPEMREVGTNGGVVYFFGASDNWVEGTLLFSSNEFGTLNTLTQRAATGDLTSTAYQIVSTDFAGVSKTAAFNAKLVSLRTSKPVEGAVKMRIRLRITSETITIT